MNEKISGYALIAVGVLMILYAVFDVFSVFSGLKKPVQLFKFNGITVDFSKIMEQQAQQAMPDIELPPGMNLDQLLNRQNNSESQPIQQEIISADMLNAPMNLFAHLFLMGFIVTAGGKIATVGTYLVRTIEVKVKEQS